MRKEEEVKGPSRESDKDQMSLAGEQAIHSDRSLELRAWQELRQITL